MKNIFKSMVLLLACAMVFSAAGCSDKSVQSDTDEVKTESGSGKDDEIRNLGGRTITYYTYWEEPEKGSTEQANLYWKVKTEVEEDYNCKFDFKFVTGEWFSTLATSIMSGKPNCDVFTAPLSNLYSSISNGLLMDLSSFDEFDFSEEKWHTATMEKGTTDTGVYAMLASNGETHNVILYNKDLMNRYKQEDLYTLQKNGELTLDKFYSVTESLLSSAKDDGIDVIAPNTYTFNFYNLLANANGVNIISREGKTLNFTCNINNSTVVNAYNKAQEMLNKGILMDTNGKDWKYPYNQFVAGKAVIYIGGSDMSGAFRDAPFEVGMCLMPTSDGGYLIDQSDAIWCGIPKGVENADDVALVFDKMIDVIFTTDYVRRYQDYLSEDAMELMKTISEESQNGNYNCDYFAMVDVWSTDVGDNFLEMVSGSKTPAQTVQTVEPVITAAIANMIDN